MIDFSNIESGDNDFFEVDTTDDHILVIEDAVLEAQNLQELLEYIFIDGDTVELAGKLVRRLQLELEQVRFEGYTEGADDADYLLFE